METNNRGKWSGRLGFILAAAGSAVGLGNLWKFPYITFENGGGVFILIYLVCIALVGVPIMVSEVLLGKLSQQNPVGAYKKLSPKSPFVLTGYLGVFTGFLILSFYAIVSGWTIEYLVRAADGNFFGDTDGRVIAHHQTKVLDNRFTKYLNEGEPDTGAGKLVAAIAQSLPEENRDALNNLPQGAKTTFVNALSGSPKPGEPFADKNLCYLQTNDKAWESYQAKLAEAKEASNAGFYTKKGFKGSEGYTKTLQQNFPGKQTEWRQSYNQSRLAPLVDTSYGDFLETGDGFKFRSRLLELRLAKNLGDSYSPKQIKAAEEKLEKKRRANKFKSTADCLDYYTAYLIPTGNIALKKEEIAKTIPASKQEAYLTSLEFGSEFVDFIDNNNSREIVFQLMILLLCAFVVVAGVQSGIQRASQIFMPVLMVLMVVVAADGIIADKEAKGLGFLFNWNIDKMDGRGALDALGHAFFTLSLGMGAMLTYGSYLSKDIDVWKSSISIVILDTGVAFLACMMIFPIIFSQDLSVSQSIGMLFTVIPQQLMGLPGGGFMVTAFYVLVGLAALTSAISLLEVMVSFLVDQFRIGRPTATLLATSATFVAGIPQALDMGLLDIADKTVNVLLPLGGFLTAIYAGWFLDKLLVSKEFKDFGYSDRTIAVYVWCNRLLAPSLVAVVIGYMAYKGIAG